MSLSICNWKYGKRWVYSITYDEALIELHEFAVPIHEEFGLPGHIEAVAGHIGQVRQIGNSSYNGFRHMSGDEMRDMMGRGWGVGNHSWSHQNIKPDMVGREIGEAKQALEEAIGSPVDLYCAPGNNNNMSDHCLEACRKYGYLGAMGITDALNRPGEQLFWLNRTALHHEYKAPFFSEYDPYRNLRHAQEDQGWIIDYCHCPLEEVVDAQKDCSADQLRRRFEAVLSEGGDDVWCPVPEEAVHYHLTHRHTTAETIADTADEKRYRLTLSGLPEAVTCRALTLDSEVPAPWCRNPRVWVNGEPRPAPLVRPGVLRITVDIHDGLELAYRAG